MSQDVAQWLGEIQSLQRQVTELKSARDKAYASADNLRNLYEKEAKQRQRDVVNAQKTIARLQTEIEALQSSGEALPLLQDEPSERLNAEIVRIQGDRSIERLQTQLIAARNQCEQLRRQLKTEQAEHAQTRESLTAALGDAVDLLAKERGMG